MKTYIIKDSFDGNTYEAIVEDKTTDKEILEYYACELDCEAKDLDIIENYKIK